MQGYISECRDPYSNIAFERELLLARQKTVFLWINDPCVIIGRNQNPWAEADIEYENTHGIRLARRFSGGGAVYQDTGNLNYSFILPEQEADIADRWLADAFHVMGIHPIPSGRNDWLIKERKFSGCARCEENGWILIHGTLMIHVDLEQLEKVLCPSPLKLRSRGIESVRSRVINLQEVIPALTISDAANAFKAAVPADFCPAVFTQATQALARDLESDSWVFAESPGWEAEYETAGPDGIYRFYFTVENGAVSDVNIFTDALDPASPRQRFQFIIGRKADLPQLFRLIDSTLKASTPRT